MPDHIRSDNGSEFNAKRVREWPERGGVKTLSIEPGSPWENGYVESFNGKLWDETPARGDYHGALGRAIPGDSVVELCAFSELGMGHYKSMIDAHTLSTDPWIGLQRWPARSLTFSGADYIESSHLDAAARFVIGGAAQREPLAHAQCP